MMIDRLEAMSTMLSDGFMIMYRRVPWTRRLILSPTEFMGIGYAAGIVAMQMTAFVTLMIGNQAIGTLVYIQGVISVNKQLHRAVPSPHTMFADYVQGLGIAAPFVSATLMGFLVLAILVACASAYFWNRRARRLRIDPPSTPLPQATPGVWPPPPRME